MHHKVGCGFFRSHTQIHYHVLGKVRGSCTSGCIVESVRKKVGIAAPVDEGVLENINFNLHYYDVGPGRPEQYRLHVGTQRMFRVQEVLWRYGFNKDCRNYFAQKENICIAVYCLKE